MTKLQPFSLKDFCDTQDEIKPPLVKGGQGRSAESVERDAAGLIIVFVIIAIVSLVLLAIFEVR